ncbi:MAG: hypothetical protein KatS3mg109_1232 [Pirellulaceae bacterium]|nr:MAG: hypothetical protein KatS3mg109_1232 [Pirellulaceae bacterium]GIW94861.1 MAG: hypothetical protein KatS3mg110_2902 [Pirellulaceae bacterium]
MAPLVRPSRPEWPAAAEVRRAWERARRRTIRIPLEVPTAGEALLTEYWPTGQAPHWAKALSMLPAVAESQIQQWEGVHQASKLSAQAKAWVAWVTARENRAWYASWHAFQRLRQMDYPEERILDHTTQEELEAVPAPILEFARRLTSEPYAIGDDDIARLRQLLSDHQIAELVYVTATCNAFDRWTECLALPIEQP